MVEECIFKKFIYYSNISLSEIDNYEEFYINYHEYLEGIIEIELDKENMQNSYVLRIKNNILIRVSKAISNNLSTNVVIYKFGRIE